LLLAISGCDKTTTALPAAPTEVLSGSMQEIVGRFRVADWDKVSDAKDELEALEERSIPALILQLDDEQTIPLENTDDLIYPGAKKFCGHGGVISYDLDYLPARAGWALEEITFEDFDFAEGAVRDVESPEQAKDRKQRVHRAVGHAKSWWREQSSWSRFKALKDALGSDSDTRQLRALQYLRFGEIPCKGLDPASFEKELLPKVRKLASSSDESVRQQAELLIDDEGWWWTWKTEPKTRSKPRRID
jgi:hypothetical protein